MKPLYLFIDESGDPGDNDGTGGNSLQYAELALQIKPEYMKELVRHITNWRYVEGIIAEPKKLPDDEGRQRDYLRPMIELHKAGGIKCSAVYLLKSKYSGPYLKADSPIWNNRIRFRNFVHKQLLEHHFNMYPPTQDDYVVAILDYYRMSRADFENVTFYLRDICELPLDNLTHLESKCSWVLQTAGQLVNTVSRIPLGSVGESTMQMLSFIALKDITYA